MKTDIGKKLAKIKSRHSARVNSGGFFGTVKNTLESKSTLAKLRNALIIFFCLIVIFKIMAYFAAQYLYGETFASFIAYSSFFFLVVGGLVLSVYFPVKYSGDELNFRMPSLNIKAKGKKSSKGEKELSRMLKNERKNTVKLTKEKQNTEKKLESVSQKYAKLEAEKKELLRKNKELEKESNKKVKKDFNGLVDSLIPKKEVVKEDGGRGKEMPKIKLSAKHRKFARKYKKLPKRQEQRIELYRNLARVVQSEDGSFSISQIMEVLLELFRDEIDEDRRRVLKEIEEWVKEDAYTPLIRTEKGINYHRIIK